MAATLRDIAQELNVLITVVSRVLNDKPGTWASEATRQRILERAREINYRPSASARACDGAHDATGGFARRCRLEPQSFGAPFGGARFDGCRRPQLSRFGVMNFSDNLHRWKTA